MSLFAAMVATAGLAVTGTFNHTAAQSVEVESSARVEGTILGSFQGVRRPLRGAVVTATGPTGERRGAVTDSAGRFSFDELPAGRVRLEVAAVGHEAIAARVTVPPGRAITVDLEMKAAPLDVAGVAVVTEAARVRTGGHDDELDSSDPQLDPEIALTLLEISPGVADEGLIRSVQALPGNDPADPSDVLFMRGSTTEMKLVLLDGVPVYTPFHVAGLMRSFEPTVLESARLHLGGAPARYDGGLTHILDLQTRTARRDRIRGTGSVDLLSTSAAVEAPLGRRAGVVASARSLHDLGEGALGGKRPYGYRDLLVSVDGEPVPEHRLRATGFWNDESVLLDSDPAGPDASWSNRVVSLGYQAAVAGARIRLDAGVSRYRATLPLQPSSRSGGALPESVIATSANDRARVTGELAWGDAQPFRLGVTLEEQRALYTAATESRSEETISEGSSTLLGVYGEGTRTLAPGVTARAGLRADFFGSSAPRLAPRLALHWSLTRDALISVAAGRYHQAGGQPDPQLRDAPPELSNTALGRGATLPVATADHVVLTLAQRLGASVSMELDGFWKRFSGVHDDGSPLLNSGIDLRVLTAGEDGSVWLGYGLSWFWSPADPAGGGTDFAGRHLLTTGMSGTLLGPLKGEARLAYGAGLPSTSLPFGSAASDELAAPAAPEAGPAPAVAQNSPTSSLDDFLRLDLELYAVLDPDWGGHSWRIRPYLRLLNALNRRDALFYTYQPWRSDAVTPLAERPILPVLGIAFSF